VNPTLHANFAARSSVRPELLPIKVLHCGNKKFHAFLLLWPRPWPGNNLHIWTWLISPQAVPIDQKWSLYVTLRLSRVIISHTDIHTRRSRGKHDHATLLWKIFWMLYFPFTQQQVPVMLPLTNPLQKTSPMTCPHLTWAAGGKRISSKPTQPSFPPGSVNEYQFWLGRQRQVWLIPLVDKRGVCR